ncbi:MAG: KamA family radical SAM protein [Thermoguttaceae bacterium]|nr:KamA family radical SAM protein [Thermoguttaceae bacterium]
MTETAFITDPAELGAMLSLPQEEITRAEEVRKTAPFRVPRRLAGLIEKGTLRDPILAQFWPKEDELRTVPGYSADPLAEQTLEENRAGIKLPDSLLWKYAGRALVMTNGACAAKCRFCFRRHTLGTAAPDWKKIAAFLENCPEIEELILSGGDPLGMARCELDTAFHYIEGLSFVKRVRIHTRYPVLFPEAVTPGLFDLFDRLRSHQKNLIFVFHLNHPSELAPDTNRKIQEFNREHYPLFSQTVLLRGINDNARILARLFTKEFELGVIPYYLHQLDRVAGAAHFEVPDEEGRVIDGELWKILPGYLVPRYVREIPGAASKIPLL